MNFRNPISSCYISERQSKGQNFGNSNAGGFLNHESREILSNLNS